MSTTILPSATSRPIIVGSMGGPTLCRLEDEWYKLSHEDRNNERHAWLQAAVLAAQTDHYTYEVYNEQVVLNYK